MDEPCPQRAGKAHTARLPAIKNPSGGTRDLMGSRHIDPRPSNVPSDLDPDAAGWDATWRKSAKGKLKCVTGHNMIHDQDVHVGKRRGKKGEKVWVVDSKKPMPFWKRSEERIPKPLKSFDMRVYGPDGMKETKNELLAGWIENYQSSQIAYSSVATWAEVMLQKVITDTAHLTRPNPLRTAVCCMLLDKVTSLFGRYEGIMTKLKEELFASIYYDWPTNTELRDGEVKLPELLPLPAQPTAKRPNMRGGSDADTDDGEEEVGNSTLTPADAAAGNPREGRPAAGIADRMAIFAEDHSLRKQMPRTPSSGASDVEAPTPYEGSRATVHVLNHKSTFYQVCRQLMFSQDSALTVDKSNNLSITDVLNAAITRWQRSILRIYFINWKLVKKTEFEKRKRALELGERLFSRRNKNHKKACFEGWRAYINQKKRRKKATEDEVRSAGININMSRKLLELEKGWENMKQQLEYHEREHDKCRGTLLKMSELLRKWRRPAGLDVGDTGEEQEETVDAEEEETDSEEDTESSEVDGDGVPKSKETEEQRAERERVLLEELDKRITEVIKAPGLEWQRHLELVDEGGWTEPPRKKVEVKVVEKRAPYKDVLHWVNSRIHCLLHPSKKVTNFATDFASCHNYGYLLHSLGATSPKGHVVSICTDPHVDSQVKAEIIVDACEALLGESLDDVVKPSDILKSKGAKNNALIFKLHKKFMNMPLPSTATRRQFAKDMNLPADQTPVDLEDPVDEEKGLIMDEFSSSSSDDEGEVVQAQGPTEKDFERWFQMYPAEKYVHKEVRRRSSHDGDGGAPGALGQSGGQVTVDGKIVTFGDILSGEHGERSSADGSMCAAGGVPGDDTAQGGARGDKSKHTTPVKAGGGSIRSRSPPPAPLQRVAGNRARSQSLQVPDTHHPVLVWLNKHLAAAGHPTVDSFNHASLRNFAAYATLLEALFPKRFHLAHARDSRMRKEVVLEAFKTVGATVVPPPDFVVAANAPQREVQKATIAEAHHHQIFLASLYAFASTREGSDSGADTAAVAEQITIAYPIADITEMLRTVLRIPHDAQLSDEAERCHDVLRRNMRQLQRIFVKHANNGEWNSRIDAKGWQELCALCGLNRYTSVRFPPLQKLPLSDIARMLLQAAADAMNRNTVPSITKGSPVSAYLEFLVEDVIVPQTPMPEMADIDVTLGSPGVQHVLEQFTPHLRKLFIGYAKPSTLRHTAYLCFPAFQQLLRDTLLLHPRKLSARMAAVAFACAQNHEAGLAFEEFCTCLALLSSFHNPMPFHSMEMQLERYLLPLTSQILASETQKRLKEGGVLQ